MNYYNEWDRHAAAWLRELIKAKLIPDGEVDTRSITDVQGSDLKGFCQCHFFAGIGGWSRALQLAGWDSNRPVWTGSCPCQSFSTAGKGKGVEDSRHLWPQFARLIRECRPDRIFGEQVEGAVGHGWLDGVFADLEAEGYTCGACVLGAHSVGAPHIRQRLYWCAKRLSDSFCGGCGKEWELGKLQEISGKRENKRVPSSITNSFYNDDRLAHSQHQRAGTGIAGEQGQLGERGDRSAIDGGDGGVEHDLCEGLEAVCQIEAGACTSNRVRDWNGPTIAWPCRDGKTRRISAEPAFFPLAHGLPGRVGLLRGAGNAIVPEVAAAFIAAGAP